VRSLAEGVQQARHEQEPEEREQDPARERPPLAVREIPVVSQLRRSGTSSTVRPSRRPGKRSFA
jgi:hypothetical protein